ncbi:LAMI_0D05578g1_1 [Lachancea mirantina]|uniref:LAMI_0D05578g1_1 n=1 Tax=Lachancea mirantina TaxID=1230905 RepID=A0A1G4JB82_9SACH|nr:LAMI_0D05578g1_1 [Lachancea mirantina]
MSEHSKETETRAQFIEEPEARLGGAKKRTLKSAIKGATSKQDGFDEETVQSSPLLTSTPPTVSKTLVHLYPYLITVNKALSVITWTNDDIWPSVLMVITYISAVLYIDNLLKYLGHMALVGVLWCYSMLNDFVEESVREYPTLDDIIHIITCVTAKAELLLSPIAILSGNDIKRLLFTTVFLSPIYMIFTLFILPPRRLILVGGVYMLTYHSTWSRVMRRLLWKFKAVRLLAFYITGLDLGGVNKSHGIFAAVQNKVMKMSSGKNATDDGKPIRFTYVLYENQRRWLGIGWTSNMLSYERAAWTDEFMNEAPPPDQFKLPEENMGLSWRWIDRTWRLDMTNDGAIQLSSNRPKTTAQPNSDDGFIFYDNTWKKPSTEDSFSKYTRRRRWIRIAELIKTDILKIDDNLPLRSSADTSVQHVEVQGDTNGTSRLSGESSTVLNNVRELESYQRKVSFSDKKDVHIIDPRGSLGVEHIKHEVEDNETNPLVLEDAVIEDIVDKQTGPTTSGYSSKPEA